MHLVRVQLTFLFLIVTTLTLAGFGWYDHLQLSSALNADFKRQQNETLTRLTISLPSLVWEYSKDSVMSILEAEMLPEEIKAITVYDLQNQIFASISRDESGGFFKNAALIPNQKIQTVSVEAKFYRNSTFGSNDTHDPINALGHILVSFSHDQIDAKLRSNILRRVLEILVIDALLVLVLSMSLGMVFKPLSQLRDALMRLSQHEGDEIKELPETKKMNLVM